MKISAIGRSTLLENSVRSRSSFRTQQTRKVIETRIDQRRLSLSIQAKHILKVKDRPKDSLKTRWQLPIDARVPGPESRKLPIRKLLYARQRPFPVQTSIRLRFQPFGRARTVTLSYHTKAVGLLLFF